MVKISEVNGLYFLFRDANHLYAHAMSRPLPIRMPNGWKLHHKNCKADSDIGYVLGADLEYRKHLHN